ncbi:MAG TPA: hypothetical protein VK547_09625 [Candidatus Udaeobacter sp.]|nr:hypothetical protein [Candidatus Udaeobacter sp.]
MTAATLTAPAAADFNEPDAACQPWCVEHWADDAVCWAPDLDLRVFPDADDKRGRITVMMTHHPKPNRYHADRTRNIAVFIDCFPDGEDGIDMDPAEAEVAAHAMLAMVELSRGRSRQAAEHRRAAESAAAALLAARTGGVL